MTKKIIYMFYTEDADGGERVVHHKIGNHIVPLMTTDDDTLPEMAEVADRISQETGDNIKLCLYENKKEMFFTYIASLGYVCGKVRSPYTYKNPLKKTSQPPDSAKPPQEEEL